MKSRPEDNKLPYFMSGINSRDGLLIPTDKSFLMNNFANSKLYNFGSTFYKKSYNKFINMSMVKSGSSRKRKKRNQATYNLLSKLKKGENLPDEYLDEVLDDIKIDEFDKITFKTVNNFHRKKHFI